MLDICVCLPERDIGHGIGHPVDLVKAAGGIEMWSIMKIDMRTTSRKEAGSMRDTETGTEKEIGITEKLAGTSFPSFTLSFLICIPEKPCFLPICHPPCR